jgi:hypothetical protein
VESQYEQYLNDEVDPFGLAMIWKGVTLMERNGKISRKLGSTFSIDADGRSVGMHRMRTEGAHIGIHKAKVGSAQHGHVCMTRQPSWSGASRSMVAQGWRAA